jgi:tellurite resistance protein TerC
LGIGLALILIFIGVKLIAEPWLHIAVSYSLGVVGILLLLTIVLSLWAGPKKGVQITSL